MGAIFQRLDELAGRATDRVYGETIMVSPRIANEYIAAQPDIARPVKEVRGIFSLEPSTDDLRGQRVSGESRGAIRMVFAEAVIQLRAAEVELLNYEPVKPDLITLIDRKSLPTYAVEHVEPLDNGDLVLYLTKENVV